MSATLVLPADRAPDLMEPVVGWRAWHALDTAQGMRLFSLVYPSEWIPGEPQVATCQHHHYRHPIDSQCTCGIHAANAPHLLIPHLVHPPIAQRGRFAIGEVHLWGRVIEGECGWRATHAYPRRIWLLDEDDHVGADMLTPHLLPYGVPVSHGHLRDLLKYAR